MGIVSSKKNQEEGDHIVVTGRPDFERCDNMITTSKYTIWTFLPVAITEQFRRFANMYFLVVGCIMAVGHYSELFESAISPWTTLGPLGFVVSVSLLAEGSADAKRHNSDRETNSSPCVILRRSEEIKADEDAVRDTTIIGGKDVLVSLSKSYFQTSNSKNPETPNNASSSSLDNIARVGFQKIPRMNIRQGHLVVVKNREMVPADMILLASSGDNGSSYIETSSIDGETNLKLRTSPQLPRKVIKHLMEGTPMVDITEEEQEESDEAGAIETLEQATKRITRFSALAYPHGVSVLENPKYQAENPVEVDLQETNTNMEGSISGLLSAVGSTLGKMSMSSVDKPKLGDGTSTIDNSTTKYIAALTSERPNPHVNTYTGKLTLPPVETDGQCFDIPLGAENVLLRGAVVRNTEWLIGLAVFTGTDTKLVQNSFQTPSKFSRLDILMNWTVVGIIIIMVLCISYLATKAVQNNGLMFDYLWYVGLNNNTEATWPYLPDLPAPKWDTSTPNWLQMFFLYVTLLSNLVPLSMYVTVEMINFMFLWLISFDLDMYDPTTNTRGLARSTNVTDLGQIKYIFSDKTGTLTQNVMRFKRCSVDGMMFGTPIQKSKPKFEGESEEENTSPSSFHPLRHLLVGRISVSNRKHLRKSHDNDDNNDNDDDFDGLGGLATFDAAMGDVETKYLEPSDERLTFDSEMFLRVMSLCHTVVVEKDLDMKENIDAAKSVSSAGSSVKNYAKKLLGVTKRNRTTSDMSTGSSVLGSPLPSVLEEQQIIEGMPEDFASRGRATSTGSCVDAPRSMDKGPDGAPLGFAYQAESPDEGALVSAASNEFGFQVVGRDSSGIRLRCAHPTVFRDLKITDALKTGQITPKTLAAESANDKEPKKCKESDMEGIIMDPTVQRIESWAILAVNKFDSDRKRMSILLRSPPELGDIPVLLCKGADSAMLDPSVCTSHSIAPTRNVGNSGAGGMPHDGSYDSDEEDDWEMAQMLGIQSHLGDFASEGLRTLVLGVRFLTEEQCETWLETFKTAASSIKDRDLKLKAAAMEIERDLHVVGATAIEDKLQVNVPQTIATLARAGIKLWVLTGDKRETAIEIGYSTHVLTPKMHLTEVADRGAQYVRTQCAMEFIRLVKAGKLPLYQRAAVDQETNGWTTENVFFFLGKIIRSIGLAFRQCAVSMRLLLAKLVGVDVEALEVTAKEITDATAAEQALLKDIERRRMVRNRAEKIIRDYMKTPEYQEEKGRTHASPDHADVDDLSLSSDEVPAVFSRAQSARTMLEKRKNEGRHGSTEKRNLALAQLTAQNIGEKSLPLVDEDTLSLNSFFPNNTDANSDFDKKKRTLLERVFSVDRAVRKGRLVRHLKKDKKMEVLSSPRSHLAVGPTTPGEGPRALVIEGAALKHLLGDPELEELIFSIASGCEAVIACRVSPRQKALLVNLVRHHVKPEPVTLAIGDGANDVGMIQEAHVGVGISGKEGQQAVNASDFAIAQFRFLEDLILIHGRWDFFRMSVVVLFSFYKNAVMAGCLIVYNNETVYSGTPLFDEWVIAMLNFVAGIPVMMLGLFDRCLEKDYVKRNPEVYQPTRENELITFRVLIRWVLLVFGHVFTLYYATVPQLSTGGGMTSAFVGLMRDTEEDKPGEGEGGDLQSVGAITYTCLILVLAYKILYESKSIVHGRWPSFTCRKDVGEGFWSRLGYTWVGVTYCSIFFWFLFIWLYSIIGERRGSQGQFFNFVGVTPHVLGMRSINWMLIFFVPVAAMIFDTSGKLFSNMFYPTQTQIHMEIEGKERADARKSARQARRRRAQARNDQSTDV